MPGKASDSDDNPGGSTGSNSDGRTVWAQEFANRLSSAQKVTPLSGDVFGESVSLFTGATTFSVTDIALPGNSALPVALQRRFDPSNLGGERHFGNFELDLPHIEAVFAGTEGDSGAGYSLDKPWERCNNNSAPPNFGDFSARDYWSGTRLSLPGGGGGELLVIGGDPKLQRPTGGPTYRWVTKDMWFFSCLDSLESGQLGKGFLAHAPDGTRYYFNYMKVAFWPGITGDGKHRLDAPVLPRNQVRIYPPRNQVRIYPTRIEDRFGNKVDYRWSPAGHLAEIEANDGRKLVIHTNPSTDKIESVTSGDRTWTYVYLAGGLSEVINPDGSRWKYTINFDPTIRYSEALEAGPGSEMVMDKSIHCGWQRVIDVALTPGGGGLRNHERRITITHPSGAQGEFRFAATRHRRANVTYDCPPAARGSSNAANSNLYSVVQDVLALKEKRVTGPGLPVRVWTYHYPEMAGGYAGSFSAVPNPNSHPSAHKQVTVAEPDQSLTRYNFGNDYGVNEGQLLITERRERPAAAGGTGVVLRTSANAYITEAEALAPATPFPAFVGTSLVAFGDQFAAAALRPVRTTTIGQGSVSFQSRTTQWDRLARPTRVVKSSTLSALNGPTSRTELTSYFDDTSRWVLGRILSVSIEGTSPAMVQNVYRTSDGLLEDVLEFGRRVERYDYHPDGTLKSVTDGREFKTSLDDWKRGIPQTITFPNAMIRAADVDDFGQIRAVTDELGKVTLYDYDAAGRLSRIKYPDEPGQTWAETHIAYQQQTAAANGIGANHWLRTETRDGGPGQPNFEKKTRYDAYWQPVLEHEQDNRNPGATQRARHWTYDYAGRVTYSAYPVAAAWNALTPAAFAFGVRTSYDSLGRPLSVAQDAQSLTEASSTANSTAVDRLHTTTYAYLADFRTVVTNPRGNATFTRFQAFDSPNSASAVQIEQPEGVTTRIQRDVFGKPLAITRSGAYLGLAQTLTRHFVYDTEQRLCKRVDPEHGATIFKYDAASNLEWSADGQPYVGTGPHQCNHGSVPPGERVGRTHDELNRLTHITYADSADDIVMSYWEDGALKSATVGAGPSAIVREYGHNDRRLLTSETLRLDGQTFVVGYRHDTLGNVSQIDYPDGSGEAMNPNALGQATTMGRYAQDATYHPNGAIAGFSYGESGSLRFSQMLNRQQLPNLRADTRYGLAFQQNLYLYDGNGNLREDVDTIGDPAQYRDASRSLRYDGLDRLTVANSASQELRSFRWGFGWGEARFTYDALDNIRRGELGPINFRYDLDGNNRLSTIVSEGGPSPGFFFGYTARGLVSSRTFEGNQYQMTWDQAHRLLTSTRIVSGGVGPSVEHYRYDAHGHRARSVRPNGEVIWQMYSQSGDLLFERSNWGSTRTYGYLAGRLIGEFNNTQQFHIHTDLVGTVRAKTDPLGTVVEEDVRAPYGSVLLGWEYRNGAAFAGHVEDAGTGLTYMKARYYDPVAMRFLSPDPVDVSTANGGNFSRYWYANNNPYTFTDPDGRFPKGCGDGTCKPSEPPPKELPAVTVTAQPPVQASTVVVPTWIGPSTVTLPAIQVTGQVAARFLAPISLVWPSPIAAPPCELPGGPSCGVAMSGSFPPGFWPGDSGAAEWGRRNGVGANEGKRRFHRGVKEHTPGARGDHDFGVNPSTGEVVDPNGEPAGNLNDE